MQKSWIDVASREELISERDECFKKIGEIWSDPNSAMARNRFDLHDQQVIMIRRIDAILGEGVA